MTIDEAIKHCEKMAERKQQEGFFRNTRANAPTVEGSKCYECASEYQQLAEWPRELKMLREVIDNKSFEITDPLDPHRHHVLVVKVTDLYNDFFDF